MKLSSTLITSVAVLLTLLACIENAGVIENDNLTSDNITDNNTALFLFDFNNVPIGKIKELKLTYNGDNTTVVNIDKSYGDHIMLNNHVAPSYSTTCGATTDNSRRITLTKGCTLAYTIAPAKAEQYNFTIPTDNGGIVFKAKGVVTSTIEPSISVDKLNYDMASKVFGAQKIYFDNITLTQSGGRLINATYVFAKVNVDPAVARFIPDDGTYAKLLSLNTGDYCTFTSDFRVTGMSGCKLLMIFYITPNDMLEPGKPTLQRGTYEASIGFLTDGENLGNSSTIVVKYP